MTRPSNPMRLLAYLHTAHPGSRDTARCAQQTGLDRRQISNAAGTLIHLGYAERVGTGDYRITRPGIDAARDAVPITSGPNGPLSVVRRYPNSLRQRLWRALRIARKSSLPELLLSAARDTDRDPETNAHGYLGALKRAGYVVDLARREPGYALTSNGYKQWLLLRDTGPEAPVWRRARKQLYDPNTGVTIDLTTGEAVT